MRRRALFSAFVVASLGIASSARAAQVESLRQAGPVDKRFNIAVLGDGYRTQDQTKLKTDATAIIDYLFKVSPLQQYAQFFNVKLVHVVSNENGADNGSFGATRDTALGAYFNCGGIDRLLCIDDGKTQTAAAADVPEFNFAIVLVNDDKYGGSGGPIGVSSSNEQSFEVLAHEIGHSLAHLADEYSYEGNQPPCSQQNDCSEANATVRTQRDQIKWRDWIEAGTPVPTPATPQYGSVVGLFEGARYTPTGVFRPQQDCKMRDLGADYCAVCTEQFVRSIWTSDNIQMIESATPAEQTVQSADCDAIDFSVTSPPITPSTYKFGWTVDGKPQAETKNSISLTPAALMQGEHQVKLVIEDSTAMVRTDPNSLLKDTHSWTVTVTKADCLPPTGGAAGTGGAGGGGTGGTAGAPLGGGGAGGGGAGTGGAPGAGSGTGGTAAGTPGTAGSSASNDGSTPVTTPAPPPHDSSRCSCKVPGVAGGDSPRSALAAGALALWGVRRRRRARR